MKTPKITSRTNSLLTNKKNLEHLYTLRKFPVFMGCVDHPMPQDVKADMSFSICQDTGMIQLDELLPLELVYQAQHNDGVGKIWQDHYREFANFLGQFDAKKILEIGGASGTIAKFYTADNPSTKWTIIEPNPIFLGNEKINVIRSWFDNKFKYNKPFDTVIHSHVFEHIYEPVEFIEYISQFLKPGQKHIFTFPNMVEQLSRKYTNCLNFEHTAFLAEPFVDILLENKGLKIIKKEYFRDHSIFYATKKAGRKSKREFPNMYKEYKQLFTRFIDYHESLIKNINQKINDFDGSIYLFGAHIFSQYLLGFGLNQDKIEAIIDNSELKNSKRLYGTRYKINYPNIISGLPSVAVILKVGAYRDEILRQLVEINPNVVIFE